MFIHTETTYGFHMPDEYEELKRFESDVDVSKARRTEDTIAVRYTFVTTATGEYKRKESE